MMTEQEAGRLEERERVARRLEEEADLMPCSEDATVYRSAATLVRVDFSYDGAEEYEDALAVAERRLAAVEAALREIEALANDHRDGWLETRHTGDGEQYRIAIDEGLKWEAVGALARALAPSPAAEPGQTLKETVAELREVGNSGARGKDVGTGDTT